MQLLEQNDIQGLIARGFGKLPEAKFILLQITDPKAVKNYLKRIADAVNTVAEHNPREFALQVALTSLGLKKIGLPAAAYKTFSREFLEGMSEPFRALILGDQNEDDPKNWAWGGPKNEEVHIALFFYAKDASILEARLADHRNNFGSNGVTVIRTHETTSQPPEAKEHFGFRDGISNPSLNGFEEKSKKENISPGDFVLGYPNEYNVVGQRPVVPGANDPLNILPVCEDEDNAGCKDLGKNGSYLVYRQMPQHVYRFWKYLYDNSKEAGTDKLDAAVRLGTKMVGRWPGGAPLVVSPDSDDPTKAEDSKFDYFDQDPDGMKCPYGAHVRRVNPRDQLVNRDSKSVSDQMVRKHRLIRRGRSYGPCCVDDLNPAKILGQGEDGIDRGLHFICLVSDLSRQFEFVQKAWVMNPTFQGLTNESDPIIGSRQTTTAAMTLQNDEFTCPASPVRRKYQDVPQFTNVVGGAYFFLPGIKALKYIASC